MVKAVSTGTVNRPSGPTWAWQNKSRRVSGPCDLSCSASASAPTSAADEIATP